MAVIRIMCINRELVDYLECVAGWGVAWCATGLEGEACLRLKVVGLNKEVEGKF